jgi:hypothetical protein
MSELVERLSLGQAIGDALLDRPSPVRPILDAAIAIGVIASQQA